MELGPANPGQLVATSNRFARRLLEIGENRLELLMVEVQEERERLLRATHQSSWFQKIFKGALLASTLWFAFWARDEKRRPNSRPSHIR